MLEEATITKLVHGGQGLGTLSDGRKVFVWNALPGEKVKLRIIKSKRSYAEAIADEVIDPSRVRIKPTEDNYLATSPWQILEFDSELEWKGSITRELFSQAGIDLPDFEVKTDGQQYGYRNKMEYSFWGDDDGLHLALHMRGSHRKQIVTGSKLAQKAIDAGAVSLLESLPEETRAGDLKTIIVRASANGDAVGSLFVKTEKFPEIALPDGLKGLRIYHSNPKSPASVPTRLLQEIGDCSLSDKLLGKEFMYDADSFFQVNIPVFEMALESIKKFVNDEPLTDMYAGVGSIGLSLASGNVDLVELDGATAAMAKVNAGSSGKSASVIEASTEKALEYIKPDHTVIFDPPRAGLHDKVTEKLLETLPPKIIYLSCNPATQARDVSHLVSSYEIKFFEVYNFFPRTPHIESLAILDRRV